MDDKILEALMKLDVNDDAHWTNDGLPRINIVEDILGVRNIKRVTITNAAPTFNRDSQKLLDEQMGENQNAGEGNTDPNAGENTSTDEDNGEDDELDEEDVIDPNADDGDEEVINTNEGELTSRDEYIERINACEERKNKAVIDIREANEFIEEMNQEIDGLIMKRDAEYPPLSFSENIQQHLKAQHARKLEKAGASPLDQAHNVRQKAVRGTVVKKD